MKKILAGFGLAAVLAGCASAGRQIDQNATAKIVRGQTTRAQVEAILGPPNLQTHTYDGSTVYTYAYARTEVKGATFIPIVGAFAGGATAQTQTFTVSFDSADIVQQTSSSSGFTDTGTGLASH